MRCPYCDEATTRVVDTRPMPDGIRRRRECSACRRRFTTHERLAQPEIRILKGGPRPAEAFERAKLARSVGRVIRRGPPGGRGSPDDATEVAERLARGIEAELLDEGVRSVSSGELAERVLARLRDVDRLAAVRFAADYTDLEGRVRFPEPGPSGEVEGEEPDPQIDLF